MGEMIDLSVNGTGTAEYVGRKQSDLPRGFPHSRTFLVAQAVKNVPGWEDPLEKEMATHSSTFAWRIPWTEKPGGLQSTGSQRIGHD